MHFLATRIKSLKNYFFLPLEWLKTCFYAFPGQLKKLFFSPLEWLKTCFDAFPSHQNQVLKKLFFLPLEWLKTCFYAFPGHQVLKKLFFYFWGGLKRVFMHLRILPDHQNNVLKNFFFTSAVVNNVFWCISTPSDSSPWKIVFGRLEWWITCFYAFPGQQNQVPKNVIFHVWVG